MGPVLPLRQQILALLYAVSGLTGLAYEVLWARMLATHFGISIFGVVIAVAAFMAGLGAGSLLGTRWIPRVNNPLKLFATVEILVAIYALLLPSLLQLIGGSIDDWAPQLSGASWAALQGGAAFCLLALPACAMGAGLPLMLNATRPSALSVGKLYGLNTLGAVAGALLPLWSLPVLGWSASVRLVAGIGLAVSLAAFWLASFKSESTPESAMTPPADKSPIGALVLYAGIGAASLMLEIGWVRLYGMVLLRTEYVLAIILAVYLLGIALGSLWAAEYEAPWIYALLPLVAGGCSLLGLWTLPMVSSWVERQNFQSIASALWMEAVMLSAVTLPVTLALGAWLPLLARRLGNAKENGGRLYGANALGAALGALAAGFISIPLLGTAATIVIAAMMLTVLGLCWAPSRFAWGALLPLLLLAVPVWRMPPAHDLLPQALPQSQDLYLYEDALALTHVVQQADGQRLLLTDLQRMDASTEPSAVKIQADQARLALLIHPAPHRVLFIGLGTGISASGSIPFPQLERSAVEISQGAIVAAARWFAPANENVLQQITVERDDARHFLSATTQRYDVIIGDLFHPDLAGLSSLLSIQQFQRARARLNKDGVFIQWLALNQFDLTALEVVLRSFRQVFPHPLLFMDGMHFAMVGTGPDFVGAARGMTENLQRLPPGLQDRATGGEGRWTWLGRYWGTIPNTAGPLQDEWLPFIEFHLPRARYAGDLRLEKLLSALLERRPTMPAAMAALGIAVADQQDFERAYVASELGARAWIASLAGDAAEAGRLTWLAYRANPHDRWIAGTLADTMLESLPQAQAQGLTEHDALERILQIDPAHIETLRALWHLERSGGNAQQAERYRQQLLAASPLDGEAAAPANALPGNASGDHHAPRQP